jgi:DNA-binding response OmpR family regulator
MKILVADDHRINRKLLLSLLEAENYQPIEACNGKEALDILLKTTEPMVALLDWQMPEMEGIEVCRRVRQRHNGPPLFLFLLTVRDSKHDIVAGLQSGANDYMTKPFNKEELLARVKIGVQMVELQQSLMERVRQLGEALSNVKQLSGLLPICGFCKKIRDDQDYWHQVEDYLAEHSGTQLSHSICPQCFETHVRPQLIQLKERV